MSDIGQVAQRPAFPLPCGENASDGVGNHKDITAQIQNTISSVQTKVMQELVGLADTLKAGIKISGGNNIQNSNGAPQIGGVSYSFSPENLAMVLLALQNKTQEAQLQTAQNGIKSNADKQKVENEKSMAKLQEWIKNSEEASAKQKTSGIFGWIKKACAIIASVFALVVAVAACVATAGAGTPAVAAIVLAVVASITIASSVVSLVNDVIKECGGKGFDNVMKWLSIEGFVASSVTEIAKACGAEKETLDKIYGAVSLLTSIAVLAATIALTGGVATAAVVGNIATKAISAARISQSLVGVVTATTDVVQGGINIAAAVDVSKASKAQAEKEKINAVIIALQQQMEEGRADIEKVIDEMMESMRIVSQMINEAGQSLEQITSNISARNQII